MVAIPSCGTKNWESFSNGKNATSGCLFTKLKDVVCDKATHGLPPFAYTYMYSFSPNIILFHCFIKCILGLAMGPLQSCCQSACVEDCALSSVVLLPGGLVAG